jgi:hypothetical protein
MTKHVCKHILTMLTLGMVNGRSKAHPIGYK